MLVHVDSDTACWFGRGPCRLAVFSIHSGPIVLANRQNTVSNAFYTHFPLFQYPFSFRRSQKEATIKDKCRMDIASGTRRASQLSAFLNQAQIKRPNMQRADFSPHANLPFGVVSWCLELTCTEISLCKLEVRVAVPACHRPAASFKILTEANYAVKPLKTQA